MACKLTTSHRRDAEASAARDLRAHRKTTNCFNADYSDFADEAFERSSPKKGIARRSIGDAFLGEIIASRLSVKSE